MNLRSEEEINLIRESSLLVAKAHAEIAGLISPGVNTLYLDKIAEEFIRDNGGSPAFKGYKGFPNTLCMSPNEQVVHGIPNNQPLRNGDILSVDCGVLMNGYYGDSAFTYEVGEVEYEIKQLLKITKESLYKGIDQFKKYDSSSRACNNIFVRDWIFLLDILSCCSCYRNYVCNVAW